MEGFDNSYMVLRKAIGILGIAFPVILFLSSVFLSSDIPFQGSISCYYHTDMRNIFEGIIWLFAIILVFYQYKGKDNIITTIAGLCALGVALCPTDVSGCATCIPPSPLNGITGHLHDIFASVFFIVLSIVSLALFTKTNMPTPTKEKRKRNRVYKVCGIIMLSCVALIAIYWTLIQHKWHCLDNANPVFWLESIALWSFGISWIVKGELVLKDKPEKTVPE